ncbi:MULTISPECIES: glycosyltransferase [unclassified Idiomarina]|uniref:glycosyltransferase n=1 Tax=unclassified Idiomarina TaxID=2614829 RepID=UPI00257A7311|nr:MULTISPECIES: glycosyltransferase [unclassified Idiomarina]|tara:strand:+ start:1177 stop:2271 length:1095 start_codon:yes stop_codon:yes gene_type:complete
MKVMHFVTGGFSGGATQVALSLVKAGQEQSDIENVLILRRKAHMPKARVEQLKQEGLKIETVNSWTHITTIFALVHLCRKHKPDIFVAHGFSEHLWGRVAAVLARVPRIVHVEHNTRERYNRFRLALSSFLNRYTDAIVGCSEGVKQVLLERGYLPQKCYAISNGIQLAPFEKTPAAWEVRKRQIVMVSRIAKQKDHATLIRAMSKLKERGIDVPLKIIGKGKNKNLLPLKRLVSQCGLSDNIEFMGYRSDVPELLMQSQIFVQCTHYEGMPLTLIEAMAAGCAVIGSEVPGVKEVIEPERTGLLHGHENDEELANAIELILSKPDLAKDMSANARNVAFEKFSTEIMHDNYHQLFRDLTHNEV